jgi:hypothetical protein
MKSRMNDGPKNNNGSHGQATPTGPIASSSDVPPELFDLHKKLCGDIWATWGQHRDKAREVIDPVVAQEKFTRISIVSLTQIAAVCAVDVGLTEEQFLATCKANFETAFKNAPRWN